MDSGLMIKELHFFYKDKSKFRINNAYVFNEESDYLVINNKDYTHEIEIKISKSDFKADFNKNKHKLISGILNNNFLYIEKAGIYNCHCYIQNKDYHQKTGLEYPFSSIVIKNINTKMVPNKFSFCVPEGLVGLEDLPDYAGLIYIDSKKQIKIIKKPKFIHKNKFSNWEGLATKYYYRLLNTGFFTD